MSDPRLTTEALRGYATARENGGRGDVPTVVAAMAIELLRLRERVRELELLVRELESEETDSEWEGELASTSGDWSRSTATRSVGWRSRVRCSLPRSIGYSGAETMMVDDEFRAGLERRMGGMASILYQHAAVLDGVDRMRAVLARYLPADVAEERARNIGAALADGVEEPEHVVIDALTTSLESHPFADRVLAIVQTRDAWTRAVRS